MRAYRWAWSVCWLAAAAVPVGMGLMVAPPVAVVCLGIMAAGAVRAATVPLGAAVCAGLAVSATVAAMWWLGPPALGLLLLAAISSPPVVRRVVGRLRRGIGRGGRGAPADPAGALGALDDRALCATWTESHAELQRARTSEERLAVVRLRQACLDELEARDAEGFQAWLRSGTPPVDDPAPFVRSHRRRGRPSSPGPASGPEPQAPPMLT